MLSVGYLDDAVLLRRLPSIVFHVSGQRSYHCQMPSTLPPLETFRFFVAGDFVEQLAG
jgi:hypothetical protein